MQAQGWNTYGILKHNGRVAQTHEDHMISQRLGSDDLLAFRCVSRSPFHVSVYMKTIVSESPFVYDQVGGHNCRLDVFHVSDMES